MRAAIGLVLGAGVLGLSGALAGCGQAGGMPDAQAGVPSQPPRAVPDVFSVPINSLNNVLPALTNDTDFSGAGLTITSVTVTQTLPPASGAVATTGGDTVRFTPPPNFTGGVTLLYTVADGNGATSAAAIVITVLPAALPPVTVPDVATVTQDDGATDIDVLANDVDLAGGGLSLTGVALTSSLPPASHTIGVSGNRVRFTPAPGFIGAAVVTYTATDVNGNSATGLLTVAVLPLDLPLGPVAVPDAAIVPQGAGATDIDVLANDVDPVGGGLDLGGVTIVSSLPPAAHAVLVSGNQVRFTPAAGFAGAVLLNYTATDANGVSATGVLSIVVSPLAVPTGPVALPDAAIVTQDSAASDLDVLSNDVDAAGGGLDLTGVAVISSLPPAAHAVAISGDQVRFTPAAGFAGAVLVTYTATDANGNSADGPLSVVVSPLDLPVGPVALPDVATVTQDSVANDIDVLLNDIDPAGGLSLTGATVASSMPSAVHTIGISGNEVRFTPAAGFAGVVVVSYTATDINGADTIGLLNIVVTPLDLPLGPVALPDAAAVTQDSGATDIDVLANDVDPAGGGLTLTGIGVTSSLPPAAHTVLISGNQVRFTPAAGFAGAVVISYTATDINGNSSAGLLNIVVSPLPLALPPVALPDVAVVSSSGGAVLIDVLANDIDPAGGGLTLTGTSILLALPPGAGSVTVVGNQIQYTPALLYIGAVTVTYTATDVNGNTTIGELVLTVVL